VSGGNVGDVLTPLDAVVVDAGEFVMTGTTMYAGSVDITTSGDITGTGTSIVAAGPVTLTGEDIAMTVTAGELTISATGQVDLVTVGGTIIAGTGVQGVGVTIRAQSPLTIAAP